jgi:uncharacterized lipoprotein
MKPVSFTFIFLLLMLTACSQGIQQTRYLDTTALELPPVIARVAKPRQPEADKADKRSQGLGESVQLAGAEERPVIKIKKLFYRSWNLVEQALKLNDITVKDKNRDLGVFYVLFAAEDEDSGEAAFFENMTSLFSNAASRKAAYQLTVVWHESDTEVAAKLVKQENDGLLDDDEDNEAFAEEVDNSVLLIQSLYETMKHDLNIH